MRLRVYMSVQAMYGAGNALYWNDSERQNSMHLTLLKYPNTKTSLYKLSKNHWVIALFKNFGSVRKKLQSTVSFDHPVDMKRKEQTLIVKCSSGKAEHGPRGSWNSILSWRHRCHRSHCWRRADCCSSNCYNTGGCHLLVAIVISAALRAVL